MNLTEYREAVRTVACPLEECLARPTEYCGEVALGAVEYVHDDRSHAYHEQQREVRRQTNADVST